MTWWFDFVAFPRPHITMFSGIQQARDLWLVGAWMAKDEPALARRDKTHSSRCDRGARVRHALPAFRSGLLEAALPARVSVGGRARAHRKGRGTTQFRKFRFAEREMGAREGRGGALEVGGYD